MGEATKGRKQVWAREETAEMREVRPPRLRSRREVVVESRNRSRRFRSELSTNAMREEAAGMKGCNGSLAVSRTIVLQMPIRVGFEITRGIMIH